MASWDGYWYLSESSIQTLLGDRLPVILDAFKQVKAQLALYLRSPSRVDIEAFIQTHMASMVVALQVDGLAQTSLQVEGNVFTLFTVVDGEAVTKTGDSKLRYLVDRRQCLWFETMKMENKVASFGNRVHSQL